MAYLFQREVEYTENQKVCARLVHRCTHTNTHTHTHTHTQMAIILVTSWRQGSILENEGILHGDKSQPYWVLRRFWRLENSWPAPILAKWWLRLGSSGFGSTSRLSLQVITYYLFRIFSTQFMTPYLFKRTHYFVLEARDSFAEVFCCTDPR